MDIGTIIEQLIYFTLGVTCLFLSIKQRRRLGDKATLVWLAGIIFIGLGLLYTILALNK